MTASDAKVIGEIRAPYVEGPSDTINFGAIGVAHTEKTVSIRFLDTEQKPTVFLFSHAVAKTLADYLLIAIQEDRT